MRLAQPDSPKVDIKLSERAGQLHVAVRTDDRELNKSLQSDLGVLVSRLEDKGYKAATWTAGERMNSARGVEPAPNPDSKGPPAGGEGSRNSRDGRDSQRRPHRHPEEPQAFQLEEEAEPHDD